MVQQHDLIRAAARHGLGQAFDEHPAVFQHRDVNRPVRQRFVQVHVGRGTVVHDHHPHAGEFVGNAVRSRCGGIDLERQHERERAALARFAAQLDALPAHQPHEARCDREAEARSTYALRIAELAEGLEYRSLVRLGNARSGVRDAEMKPAIPVGEVVEPDSDLDFTLIRVLDRIRQEVAEHLPQAQHVAHHRRWHRWLHATDELELLALARAANTSPTCSTKSRTSKISRTSSILPA